MTTRFAEGTDPAPLTGVRVLDLSALGPGPFCSMLLADFGADVISVERPGVPAAFDPAANLARGKRSVVVDLRNPLGAEAIARLADGCDVLLESNRPGTMERHGLGPEILCARNPGLIYTRLTGWGQDGPYSSRAGHDINYTAVAGSLGVIGEAAPVPPLALVGDLAGGSLTAAFGIMLALFERKATGRGQVIDAAIADGSALLNVTQLGEFNVGRWRGRGSHVLSGVAPFYTVYACADGRYFAVGALERKFYVQFLSAMGLEDVRPDDQMDVTGWPTLRSRIARLFAAKPRSHWSAIFADNDGCGSPVLELDDLADDPHLRARGTIRAGDDGTVTAAPAPRLSRTPGRVRPSGAGRGADTRAVLGEFGYTGAQIDELVTVGAVGVADQLRDGQRAPGAAANEAQP